MGLFDTLKKEAIKKTIEVEKLLNEANEAYQKEKEKQKEDNK